jgi:hypothetical protein
VTGIKDKAKEIADKAKDAAGKAKDKVDDLVDKNREKLPDKLEHAYDKVSAKAEKVLPGDAGGYPTVISGPDAARSAGANTAGTAPTNPSPVEQPTPEGT